MQKNVDDLCITNTWYQKIQDNVKKKSMFIYGHNDLCVDNEEVTLWLLHDRLLLLLLSRFICVSVGLWAIILVTLVYRAEKAMAPHSSTLAWKIPWTEESGGLPSIGSHRVGHDWVTSLSLFTFMHWRRKWQPTPVFLPGESQGLRSLVGCHLWGRTESDTTEAT